jgi:uncharacterized protein (TIGR02246 family)
MIAVVLLLLGSLTQTDNEPYQRFSAAYATLDAQRVGLVYTEDAFSLPPGGDIIRGRANIAEQYEDAFREARGRGHTRRITFEFVDRTAAGDIRNDIGYYTIVTTDPEGHVQRHRGKFLKVWRREADGVWRIRSDSYSSAVRR